MHLYNHTIKGHEDNAQEMAMEHARGIDWQSTELSSKEVRKINYTFIGTANGINVYRDLMGDYVFTPEEELELSDYTIELVGGRFGIYVAQTFVERWARQLTNSNELAEHLDIISDIHHEEYHDSWAVVLDAARLKIDETMYHVRYIDSNLFAVDVDIPESLIEDLNI